MLLKINKKLLLLLLFFGTLFSLISFVNHYNFRTYALDLGLYTNALYKYSRLIPADSLMIKENYEYILGGHFDLYLVLFSPLVYLFGTYTLLVVQIISILIGGLGVYRYFRFTAPNHKNLPYFATLYFFLFYGIYAALSFDYHSIVVAAMAVPWFFYFLKRSKFLAASLTFLFILISQENAALWLTFICIGLFFEYWENRKMLLFLSVCLLVAVIYFLSLFYVVIPKLSMWNQYGGFLYSVLGKTPVEAVKNLILHPTDNFQVLFLNHTNSEGADHVKLELHLFILISGAYLLFAKPQYLIMLIPIYIQKLFHDNNGMWGVSGQYSIEFAPILTIGIFSVIAGLKNQNHKKLLTFLVTSGAVLVTTRLMDRTQAYINKTNIRVYKSSHYKKDYDVKKVHALIDEIPAEARVSAQSSFAPHLALRNTIYQFPIVKDAEYIVCSFKEGKYPLTEETFAVEINKIRNSGNWKLVFENDDIVLLKRVAL